MTTKSQKIGRRYTVTELAYGRSVVLPGDLSLTLDNKKNVISRKVNFLCSIFAIRLLFENLSQCLPSGRVITLYS